MKVINNEQIVCIDIDKTLVSPCGLDYDLFLTNPYSKTTKEYKTHRNNIELLRQYKGRGNFVVVWSAGGVLWAEEVIRSLGLESYVDMIMTKPNKYVDDLPVEQWMTTRIFLEDE